MKSLILTISVVFITLVLPVFAGEVHMPPELHGDPRFEWFDGGVWAYEDPERDRNRAIGQRALKGSGKDLEQIFKPGNPLYSFLGSHLEFINGKGRVVKIIFGTSNTCKVPHLRAT